MKCVLCGSDKPDHVVKNASFSQLFSIYLRILTVFLCVSSVVDAGDRPNVVLIVADDLG